MRSLENKVALITGATSGIGREAALLFAAEGAKVVVSGRRVAEGEAVVAEIRKAGGEATFVRADVSKSADVAALVAATTKTYGAIDVAFNNAGIEGAFAPLADLTEAVVDDLLAINVKGAFLSLQHEVPALSPGASIIFNASIVADIGMSGATAYAATKGAIVALARAAAVELAPSKIRVNVVSPGVTLTEMAERVFGGAESASAIGGRLQPLGRIATPLDIARAALFLASEQSSFITGQVLNIDGGYTAQ